MLQWRFIRGHHVSHGQTLSTMPFYPAFFDLKNKDCLVVGGGTLAFHKAQALLRCGARVTVTAPRLAPGFKRRQGMILRRRPFRASDLAGARRPWLVVAATDNAETNRRVSALCARRRVWVNVVDRPALCSFILPAVARRGRLTLAVSTGGASPALAKYVGARLKRWVGPEYGLMADVLARWRAALLKLPMGRRRRLLAEVLTEPWFRRLRREGRKNVDSFIKRRIAAE